MNSHPIFYLYVSFLKPIRGVARHVNECGYKFTARGLGAAGRGSRGAKHPGSS